MSHDGEIEFGTVGSPGWDRILLETKVEADQRLQNRYDATKNGVEKFQHSAGALIDEVFQKPPGKISPFGVFVEVALTFCAFVVPEEAIVAKLIAEAAKTAFEEVKPVVEYADKVSEEIVANTVEEAVKQMKAMVDQTCEQIPTDALKITQAAQNAVESALREHVTANPLPFDQTTGQELCEALGIQVPDVGLVSEEAANKAFFPFREKVLTFTAQRHFFHDLDDDVQRLEFLIDEIAAKGTDPDAFLDLIGADRSQFDPYLEIYRSQGRAEALNAKLYGFGEGSEATSS